MFVVWHVLWAGLWGGFLAVERSAILQAMFSRPLVASIGTGLFLGDIEAGLYVGVVFELFYLGSASLGGHHPDHDTLPSVCASAFAATWANASSSHGTPATAAMAILLFAPLGRLGRSLERYLDDRAGKLEHKALLRADAGDLKRAARESLFGVGPHFFAFGLPCALAAALGYLAAPLEERLSVEALRGLAWAYPAMACASAAMSVLGSHAYRARRIATLAASFIAIVSFLIWFQEGAFE